MENDGIFDVLDDFFTQNLKSGFFLPAVMGGFAGKPWTRARTVGFKRTAGFVLSAWKLDLKILTRREREDLENKIRSRFAFP